MADLKTSTKNTIKITYTNIETSQYKEQKTLVSLLIQQLD